MTAAAIAKALADARLAGIKLKNYPGPAPESAEAAFAIQSQVSELLGWRRCGWKIGCTSERAQKALNTDGPLAGAVFAERLYGSGATVPTALEAMRVVEPEIAFTMKADLPARRRPYGVAEVLAAVGSVHGALENVNRRAPGGFADGITWAIADGGLNDALVLGPGHPPIPAEDYRAIAAQAYVNGSRKAAGVGANALGGPELALTWLANFLSRHGLGLRASDVVTTGVITDLLTPAVGERVEADFGPLGMVSATYITA